MLDECITCLAVRTSVDIAGSRLGAGNFLCEKGWHIFDKGRHRLADMVDDETNMSVACAGIVGEVGHGLIGVEYRFRTPMADLIEEWGLFAEMCAYKFLMVTAHCHQQFRFDK